MKQPLWTLFSLALLATTFLPSQALARLALVGVAANAAGLTPEELGAYSWALRNYDAEYVSLAELKASPQKLAGFNVVWYHHTRSLLLPPIAEDPGITTALKNHVESGRGLLLSGVAPQLVVPLGIEDHGPSTVTQDPRPAGNWGFGSRDASHPVFTGLPASFSTVSEGMRVENTLCWWDDPATFNGKWLGDLEWSAGKVALGEYSIGQGHILVIGAGAFTFNPSAGPNLNASNLERLTVNMLRYLGEHRTERASSRLNSLGWYDDPTKAFVAAKSAEKPLLVLFYKRDHSLSTVLEKQLAETPDLTDYLRENSYFARIDVDSVNNHDLVKKFSIRRVPTVVVFNTDGSQAGRIEGVPELGDLRSRIHGIYSK